MDVEAVVRRLDATANELVPRVWGTPRGPWARRRVVMWVPAAFVLLGPGT
ncbi:hypothetical protein [Streptomyces sp. NPDC017964]